MYCPRCGARQPLGTTRCAECGAPFTRREAMRRPNPQYAGTSNTAAASYRRYERRSGVRKGLLAWLAVVLVAVIVVIGLVAFFSTSIIKPYVGKSVSNQLDDKIGSTIIGVTPNSGAALAGQTLTISQAQINQKITENAASLGPLDDVHVQITDEAFVVDFSSYGVSGQYTGQVVMQNGSPVLTNGHISGALGWVVPTDEVEAAFNKQIAAAVDQAGVQVSSVAMQPGQLVLTLAS